MERPKSPKRSIPPVFHDRTGKTFGTRLAYLKRRHAMLAGPISNREIGDRVADKLGGESYRGATISGWLRDQWAPDTRVIAAVADVFRCDPGWLAFGENTQAPSPDAVARGDIEQGAFERVAALLTRERAELPAIPETMGPERRPRASSARRRPREA